MASKTAKEANVSVVTIGPVHHYPRTDQSSLFRRRLSKAGVPLPPFLNELELRGDDLDPALHEILTQVRCKHAISAR